MKKIISVLALLSSVGFTAAAEPVEFARCSGTNFTLDFSREGQPTEIRINGESHQVTVYSFDGSQSVWIRLQDGRDIDFGWNAERDRETRGTFYYRNTDGTNSPSSTCRLVPLEEAAAIRSYRAPTIAQ